MAAVVEEEGEDGTITKDQEAVAVLLPAPAKIKLMLLGDSCTFITMYFFFQAFGIDFFVM